MDYNFSYSNAYSDSYFTPTSFDLDITDPIFHNFNQSSMPYWFYPNQYMPQPQDYDHNYSYAYNDPYFNPTSFDSDITNLAYHNFN